MAGSLALFCRILPIAHPTFPRIASIYEPTSRSDTRPPVDLIGVGVWGFAEATFFFLVPDVLLTAIALRDLRRALWACALAATTALGGGLVMYGWGAHDVEQARSVLDWVPGISPELITHAGEEVRTRELVALFLAPLRGEPYKVFAVEAGQFGAPLLGFMVVTMLSRLSRFVLLTLLAALVRKALCKKLSPRSLLAIHLVLWTAFYSVYFSIMPN